MDTIEARKKKFHPERPIFLNEANTGKKTKAEVLLAVQQLRDMGWLCVYGEKARPFHISFNDERMLSEFKKDAKNLGIALKAPIIKQDDLEELLAEDNKGQVVPGAEDSESADKEAISLE